MHCVHVGSYVNDPSERDVTSFGVRDVTMMNDVSRCDVADKVLAGPYRCSPAMQVTSTNTNKWSVRRVCHVWHAIQYDPLTCAQKLMGLLLRYIN